MRTRRLLLATTALSTMAVAACTKDRPLPANPKGSGYDSGSTVPDPGPPPEPLPANPKGSHYDAGMLEPAPPPPPPTATPTPKPIPPPANPKGSHYDAGLRPKTTKD